MNICGYEIKSGEPLAHWDPILAAWLKCLEKFARLTRSEHEADAAHVHSESMDRHMVSVAAWQAGYIAKQDFGIWKFAPNGKRWWGRADLWIKSEDATDLIEAKTHWPELDWSDKDKWLLGPLLDALGDARAHDPHAATNRIGLGFVVPHHDTKKDLDSETLIHEWVSVARKLDTDILAWSFPSDVRDVVTKPEMNHVFPGTLLLGKRVKEELHV